MAKLIRALRRAINYYDSDLAYDWYQYHNI
jgi:hypothetical protein